MSEKAGVIFYEVNPKHTSQECSCCHYISPTNRDKERFLCEHCGYFCDADLQASINVRERGLKELQLSLLDLLESREDQ
jgi:putative transposase